MINERIMSQGSFDIPFSVEAPLSLWNDIDDFGHIVITPQWIDHRLFDDATMLSMARYAGVVLDHTLDENGLKISGAGMVWWLGDEEEKGPIIETVASLTDATLTASLTAVLPSSVTLGTIVEPPATYTGEHQWETSLAAVRTIVASLGCEYRVNPDATIDAGPPNDVYNVDAPVVVVTRTKRSGGDPSYKGVDVTRMRTNLNSRPYVSRGIVITEDSNNVLILVGGQDRSPAPTARDMHGNLIDRTLMIQTSGSPVDVTLYLQTQMNEHTTVSNQEVGTDFFEIQNGDLALGDSFWCYDPPAFQNPSNEVFFRGDVIHPISIRLIAASWPLLEGMGVYYRSPEVTPVYTDLSPYIAWESEARQTIGIRI